MLPHRVAPHAARPHPRADVGCALAAAARRKRHQTCPEPRARPSPTLPPCRCWRRGRWPVWRRGGSPGTRPPTVPAASRPASRLGAHAGPGSSPSLPSAPMPLLCWSCRPQRRFATDPCRSCMIRSSPTRAGTSPGPGSGLPHGRARSCCRRPCSCRRKPFFAVVKRRVEKMKWLRVSLHSTTAEVIAHATEETLLQTSTVPQASLPCHSVAVCVAHSSWTIHNTAQQLSEKLLP